jgi:hypothetical protein
VVILLTHLFGNKNIERILLFLFVNEKCYGTQLQILLRVPLTPIQKALFRLEKGGVLQSHYEGKTRIYEMNPLYFLRTELEILLKKVYAHLSTQEKRHYCFIHKPRIDLEDERMRNRSARNDLLAFWERLGQIKYLSFSAKTRQGEEKNIKTGKADVTVSALSPSTYVFQEKGHWFLEDLPDRAFSNSFRWSLDLTNDLIALDHLRYGPSHPVFLLHLAPTKPSLLESVDSHLCAEDTYLGNIIWSQKEIRFHWRIIGPRKNDELLYQYV